MDKRYTTEGLPIVTEEILKSFFAELERNLRIDDPRVNLETWLNQIELENKFILPYLNRMSAMYPPSLTVMTASVMAGVYHLLKSQANNYKIEDLFIDDSTNLSENFK
ncbi:hypothetical protein KAT24_00775 [Candidatus Pacearchaeota archaeon]|nr:hypothetical protein [Candidatus Pacearchaeota archaeon]